MHNPLTHYPDGQPRHQSVADVLQFFAYEHLPPNLQAVSKPFGELAMAMADALSSSAELTVGLRKLLEAKDAMVRARVGKFGRAAVTIDGAVLAAAVTKDPPPDPPPPPPPTRADGAA